MDEDVSPEERKYVEIYEQVSHEIQEKKDPQQIVRELMEEGYNEQDARQWVEAVAGQLRSKMVQRSLLVLIPGIAMLLIGLVLRIAAINNYVDTSFFDSWLMFSGAVLSIWGLASWARYR
jgi:hypothetical protein